MISTAGQSFWYQADNQIKVPVQGTQQLLTVSPIKNVGLLHSSKAGILPKTIFLLIVDLSIYIRRNRDMYSQLYNIIHITNTVQWPYVHRYLLAKLHSYLPWCLDRSNSTSDMGGPV